jgi:hypothetical protein
MDKKLPIFDIVLNDEDLKQGVGMISLVDDPAIGVNWIKLRNQSLVDIEMSFTLTEKGICLGCPPTGDGNKKDGSPDKRCGDGVRKTSSKNPKKPKAEEPKKVTEEDAKNIIKESQNYGVSEYSIRNNKASMPVDFDDETHKKMMNTLGTLPPDGYRKRFSKGEISKVQQYGPAWLDGAKMEKDGFYEVKLKDGAKFYYSPKKKKFMIEDGPGSRGFGHSSTKDFLKSLT